MHLHATRVQGSSHFAHSCAWHTTQPALNSGDLQTYNICIYIYMYIYMCIYDTKSVRVRRQKMRLQCLCVGGALPQASGDVALSSL